MARYVYRGPEDHDTMQIDQTHIEYLGERGGE